VHFLLKAQHQHLAVNCGNLIERRVNARFLLLGQNLVQGRRLIVRGDLERRALLRVGELVEALDFSLALPVDDQVSSDGKQPGFKF